MNKMNLSNDICRRIWSKVNIPKDFENLCWKWLFGKDKDGYGITSVFGKWTRAHRFAYEFYNGPIPYGMCVCHSCNNPDCMSPYHLYLDDNTGNTQYKVECNRQTKGENVNTSILNELDVELILMNILIGKYNNISEIAKLYNVTRDCIYDILSNKNWKHITRKFTIDNKIELDSLKLRVIGNYGHKGENNNKAKLKESQVKHIKHLLKTQTVKQIHLNYSFISIATLYQIKQNRIWKHVT
jgi:hypothetical protein